MIKKTKISKEQPQYKTQVQYEGKFKLDFNKSLILMNKAIIKKLSDGIKQ